jgi:hypothetical protein
MVQFNEVIKDTLLLRFYFTLHIPKLVSNDIDLFKLENEDTKFFGKEASLMVLEEWKRRSPGSFELVSSQPDFVNEVTLLQYFTEQRSVPAGCQLMLIHSPKCRPELAGEGIDKMLKRMKEESLHGDVEG